MEIGQKTDVSSSEPVPFIVPNDYARRAISRIS